LNTLIGYGFPFEVTASSCSDRIPKNFRWTYPKYGEKIDQLILIDNTITQYENLPPDIGTLYGWVCESRSIVPELSKFLLWNYDKLKLRFSKIFVSDKSLPQISNVFQYCPAGSNLPWISESQYAIYDKSKLISMIASQKTFTKGHQIRHQYAERFKSHIDLFGGACGSPKLGLDQSSRVPWKSKIQGLKDYMFHIVVENDFYDNYYTEKLTDCFATGTIPVYYGSPTVGETFNMDGIILLDEKFDINSLNQDLYMSKLDAVEDNFQRVKNIKMADNVLFEMINNG
jgi:hypothetical protein